MRLESFKRRADLRSFYFCVFDAASNLLIENQAALTIWAHAGELLGMNSTNTAMLSAHEKVASYDQTRTPKTANHRANQKQTKNRNVKWRKVQLTLGQKLSRVYFLKNPTANNLKLV
jgi:hypothetical protein